VYLNVDKWGGAKDVELPMSSKLQLRITKKDIRHHLVSNKALTVADRTLRSRSSHW
jgi:antitoxin component of MazEF toxin-antitoxin module